MAPMAETEKPDKPAVQPTAAQAAEPKKGEKEKGEKKSEGDRQTFHR